MADQFDAVIIGSGLGGLAAAARLAKAGKKVLVLEQDATIGGYARGGRRGDFYFDFSLHYMDGIAPGGWAFLTLQKLGVLERVTFDRLDPYYVARYPDREVIAYANPFEYEAELIRHFPHEANGIRSLLDEIVNTYRDAHRGRVDHALGRYPPPEEMLTLHPSIVRAVRETWSDLLARHISNPDLRAVLSAPWGYCGLPPSRLSSAGLALLLASAHYYGAFYPRGGSAAINRALEAVIREGGGEIHCRQKVTGIQIEDGLAVGVKTDSGFAAQARVFVSNANAPDTFLNLISPEHLPRGYASRIAVTPDSLSSFNIYLGLERNLAAEGWPPHLALIADSYDPEAQYAAIMAGDWHQASYMLAHHTHTCADHAPQNKSTLVVMCLAPWNYDNVWGTGGDLRHYQENPAYQQVKESVAEILLARLEKHLPGLRSAICYKEIATPLTNMHYTLNRGGAIYGSEQSAENMCLGRLNEETPIPNLFLAGAWTLPGGGQSAALLSGLDAGGHSLLYLDNKPREVTFFAAVPTPGDKGMSPPDRSLEGSKCIACLPPGQPAPDFKLTATVSGREISLQTCAGRPLVLLFVTQNTTAAIDTLNEAVRSQLPLATQAVIASVFDFGQVPPLFHKLIELVLKRAYRQAARGVPSDLDLDPADYVIILPDWSGQVSKAFGVQGIDKAAAAVVIDRLGQVQGAFQGDGLADTVLNTLKWL